MLSFRTFSHTRVEARVTTVTGIVARETSDLRGNPTVEEEELGGEGTFRGRAAFGR